MANVTDSEQTWIMDLQRDPRRDFLEQVGEVMAALLTELRKFPPEGNPSLSEFPHGSCSVTSWVIGSMLRDLGFGDWTLVSGMEDAEENLWNFPQSHVWLELRENEITHFSLDATAGQFSEWKNGPFAAKGESTLALRFSCKIGETLISQPEGWHSDEYHARPLEYVRRSIFGSDI